MFGEQSMMNSKFDSGKTLFITLLDKSYLKINFISVLYSKSPREFDRF